MERGRRELSQRPPRPMGSLPRLPHGAAAAAAPAGRHAGQGRLSACQPARLLPVCPCDLNHCPCDLNHCPCDLNHCLCDFNHHHHHHHHHHLSVSFLPPCSLGRWVRGRSLPIDPRRRTPPPAIVPADYLVPASSPFSPSPSIPPPVTFLYFY